MIIALNYKLFIYLFILFFAFLELDVWEHLPIVPIREDARQAVKEPVFVQLLKNLGLTPPQADQVTTPTKY